MPIYWLLRNLFSRQVCRALIQTSSRRASWDNDQTIEQLEADGRNHKQSMAAICGAWFRRIGPNFDRTGHLPIWRLN